MVIVILAIIALVSTPMILNIVNKARRSAFLDSSYGIMESAKLYYTEGMLDGGLSTDKTFLFEGDIPEGLNYSGTSPKGGMLILGVNEYVMGVYRGSDANSTWGARVSSGIENNDAGFTEAPAAKYYDEYKINSVATACNNTICYGHALSETSRWYNNQSSSSFYVAPWVCRGGPYNGGTISGIFAFIFTSGANGARSFRVVLLGE